MAEKTSEIPVLKPGPVCSVCPLYAGCTAICEPVESLLPSMERARLDWEDLPRLYLGVHLTHALLDNLELLTDKQREIVRLYYRESMLQREIAELLQVSQQAVHDALVRARMTVGERLKLRADVYNGNGHSKNGAAHPNGHTNGSGEV